MVACFPFKLKRGSAGWTRAVALFDQRTTEDGRLAIRNGSPPAASAHKTLIAVVWVNGIGVPSASNPYNCANAAPQRFCTKTPMPAAVPASFGFVAMAPDCA